MGRGKVIHPFLVCVRTILYSYSSCFATDSSRIIN